MNEFRKAGLILLLTFSLIGLKLLKSRYDWSGPRGSASGKVISCTSVYSSDNGLIYTTTYEFSDEHGRAWKNSTAGIRYCLPPGTALKIEWPDGHPERSRAHEPLGRPAA